MIICIYKLAILWCMIYKISVGSVTQYALQIIPGSVSSCPLQIKVKPIVNII